MKENMTRKEIERWLYWEDLKASLTVISYIGIVVLLIAYIVFMIFI